MKKKFSIVITFLIIKVIYSQNIFYETYHNEFENIGTAFLEQFYQYPNFIDIYKLEPRDFIDRIEMYKLPFDKLLESYNEKFDSQFINIQMTSNDLVFDKYLLEYHSNHKMYTKEDRELPFLIKNRLNENIYKFNNPEYLELDGYREYIKAFLKIKTSELLKNESFKNSDNTELSRVAQSVAAGNIGCSD